MARRPVWYVPHEGNAALPGIAGAAIPAEDRIPECPLIRVAEPEFTWNGGFAVTQYRKNIAGLHEAFLAEHPGLKILEASSKSESELGQKLSAFRLTIRTAKQTFPVESAYQAAKVFERGGPYPDLLALPPLEAKRDPRLKAGGEIIGFSLMGRDFPIEPKSYFYNWLYINALALHPELADEAAGYDAFTDITFNPAKQVSCQAEALAIYAALVRSGRLEAALSGQEAFRAVVYPDGDGQKTANKQTFSQLEFLNL